MPELDMLQIKADLTLVKDTLEKICTSDDIARKEVKYLKNQIAYHLQQACEKLIKIQIYRSGITVNNHSMYTHNLGALIQYGRSIGVNLVIPAYIGKHHFDISSWEAQGRYDVHMSIRIDTLNRTAKETDEWYLELERLYRRRGK